MHRFLIGIVLIAALATGALAQGKTFTVMLIMFRGATPAEHGFMEYL
jgi:hypothetical protein